MSKYQLYNGDCLKLIESMDPVKCIFADPPDNIDLGYGEYEDKMPDDDYIALFERWINAFIEKADITWLSFNARWTIRVAAILDRLERKVWEVKPCVQVFTFGQHNKNDFGNNHRPLWRIMRKGTKLYPEQVKVASWRQRNGDKRAAPGGRVPGDVLDFQYAHGSPALGSWLSAALDDPSVCAELKRDIEAWFETCPGDVMDFPRVTGNSKQRCDWHPTQLHEELVKRAVLISTVEGDRTADPFGGTGTTMRVCKQIGRPCTLLEIDSGYCEHIAKTEGLKRRKAGVWSS